MRFKEKTYVAVSVATGEREEFSTLRKMSAATGVSVEQILSGKRKRGCPYVFEIRDVEYKVVTKEGDEVLCRWDKKRRRLVEQKSGMALRNSWIWQCSM